MKGTISEAKPLLEILRTARAYLKDIPIQADSKGLSIVGLDPANIVLVKAEIDAAEFDDWQADQKEAIGIARDNLRMLDRIKAANQMSIETKDGVLHITTEIEGRTIEYTSPLWATDYAGPRYESGQKAAVGIKIPPGAEFTIHTKVLKDILGKMEVAGEHYTIIARPNDNKLYFTNQIGPQKPDKRVETKVDQEHKIGKGKGEQPVLPEIKVEQGAMTTYLIADTSRFLEHADDYINIAYATNHPLKLVKRPSDLTSITMYLAPHIEEIRATEATETEQEEEEE